MAIQQNNVNIQHIPVKIEKQPKNLTDRTAITVLIDVENYGDWKEWGTIPKKKIVKINYVLKRQWTQLMYITSTSM